MSKNQEILDFFKPKNVSNGSFVTSCPVHDDKSPSLSIQLQEDDSNPLMKCHSGCSQEALIDFMKEKELWSFKKVTETESSFYVKTTWESSEPISPDNLGHTYLTTRGLNPGLDVLNLRFNPNCFYSKGEYHPALIAKIQKDGDFIAIQRIYINKEGKKLEADDNKKILGKFQGGYCQFGQNPSDVLHLAEGPETAFAVYQALKEPTWATITANNLSKVKLAKTVKTVHIWADKDKSGTGYKEALKAARLFASLGIDCYIHLPVGELGSHKSIDFLDILNIDGEEAIREDLQGGEYFKAKKLSPFALPHHDLPVVDQSFLPNQIWLWASANASRLSVPIEMILIPFLSTIGSLIGRKIGIKMKNLDDHIEYPNLWGLIICPPSSKKTPCLGLSTNKLTAIEGQFIHNAEEIHERYLAKCMRIEQDIKNLQAAKKTGSDGNLSPEVIEEKIVALNLEKKNAKPKPKRLIQQSSTIEKLIEVLKDNANGILVMRDEIFGLFDTFSKKGHEGARQFYLEGWNGKDSFSYDTLSRGIKFIPHLCLTLLGCTQPSRIAQIIQNVRNNRENDGFIQRFQLMIFPNKFGDGGFIDKPTVIKDEKVIEDLFKFVVDLDPVKMDEFQSNLTSPIVQLSPEAYEAYSTYFDKLDREAKACPDEALSAHLSKYHKLISGLTLIFFVVESYLEKSGHKKVQLHTVEMAIKWTELFKAHAEKVYNYNKHSHGVMAQHLAQKIKEGLVCDGDTIRSIYRHKWSLLTTNDEVLLAVNYLSELGWLTLTDEKKDVGRASEVIKFHPDLEKFIQTKEAGL